MTGIKVELSFLKMLSNAICKTSLVSADLFLGLFVWNVAAVYLVTSFFPYNHSFFTTQSLGKAIHATKTTGKYYVENPGVLYSFPSYSLLKAELPASHSCSSR